MVSDQTAADDRVKAATEARDEAESLLRRLLADRERLVAYGLAAPGVTRR